MTKQDWVRKLTSRKFWLALCEFVSGIMLAFKVDATTVEVICGVIMSGAGVIAFLIAEGLVDAARESGDTAVIVQPEEKPPEAE